MCATKRWLLVLFVSMVAPSVSADEYGFERDKQLHLGLSTAIGGASVLGFRALEVDNRLYEYGSCLGVGLAKELYDEFSYGGWSNADLAYDAAGCALGIEVLRLTDWALPDGAWVSLAPLRGGFSVLIGGRF